jgi:uncharacterized SAM-binding protein YcdF (DUF218 family)
MYRFVVILLEPYTFFWLLTVLVVLSLWRARRETRRRLAWLTGAFVALTLISVPAVSYLALGSLEWKHSPLEERPAETEALVVLAGGVNHPGPGRSEPELDADSMQRCIHAVSLYRQGKPCPIVLCGGPVESGAGQPVGARVMRAFLLQVGVRDSDLLLEETSRTTYENAVECRKLLDRYEIRSVVLVTDAVHMPRALSCFQKQGIDPVPSPCNYRAARMDHLLLAFVPRAGAARGCQLAAHEWLGMAWYRLRGRL